MVVFPAFLKVLKAANPVKMHHVTQLTSNSYHKASKQHELQL